MNGNTEGLEQVTHEPPNPMDVDVPKRTCPQTEEYDLLTEEGEPTGDTIDMPCNRDLVYERHGDEIQYACTEHGWQATIFEEQSGQ